MTGVRLVRSTNGAITVTAAAPSPAVSSGSSGISGGAIAGIIVGVIALLLVAGMGRGTPFPADLPLPRTMTLGGHALGIQSVEATPMARMECVVDGVGRPSC